MTAPPAAPAPQPPDRSARVHPALGLGIVTLVVGLAVGLLFLWGRGERPELVVDNATGVDVTVTLDSAAATVPPRSIARLAVAPGRHVATVAGMERRFGFDVRAPSPHSWLLHLGDERATLLVLAYAEPDRPSLVSSMALSVEPGPTLVEVPARHVDGVDDTVACTETAPTVTIVHLCHEVDGRPACTCPEGCASVCAEAFEPLR